MQNFELRDFQKAAIRALDKPVTIDSHVLCVAPTGSGKSLIYEKAAAHGHRRTLLITPLVALARQQFEKLNLAGIPTSLGIGGHPFSPPNERSGAWIMSPEILRFLPRRALVKKWKPNLLVVDECHCLWQWGENFRPAFADIPGLLSDFMIPHSLWLTATLPTEARAALRLMLPQSLFEVGKFDLPHGLTLFIQKITMNQRIEALVAFVQRHPGRGIVFVPTRDSTVRITRLIERSTGKSVLTYHAGMSREERNIVEKRLRESTVDIVVSTSAFGMGMDYTHLEYVVLWQAPNSLLSMVQAVGRAGRGNGKPGTALVFWDESDFKMLEWTIQNSKIRRKELENLIEFVRSSACRKSLLQSYFGETPSTGGCSRCDFCLKA